MKAYIRKYICAKCGGIIALQEGVCTECLSEFSWNLLPWFFRVRQGNYAVAKPSNRMQDGPTRDGRAQKVTCHKTAPQIGRAHV